MRFYSFINGLYMNSLQYGLQTGHAISEMSLQQSPIYLEWAKNNKTIIILDALNHSGLQRVYGALGILCGAYNTMVEPEEAIPYVKFHEDEQSLSGIMTCVSVILPKHIYDREEIRPHPGKLNTPDEEDFLYKSPRERFAVAEAEITDTVHWKKERLEDLLYCLIKSYNLANR